MNQEQILQTLKLIRSINHNKKKQWITEQGYTTPNTNDLYELDQRITQILYETLASTINSTP